MEQILLHDQGHGFDLFGMSRRSIERVLPVMRWFHDRYFRVTSHGTENIPAQGAAILASNHSGMLPVDGALLYTDVLLHTHPPRVARPVMDHFVPRLPRLGVTAAQTDTLLVDNPRSVFSAADRRRAMGGNDV